jgi:hypothetical protein
MKPVLGLILTYLIVNLGVVASGVGIGLLLRRVLPAVDLGAGILIGVVATGLSIHFFLRLLSFAEVFDLTDLEGDDFAPPVRVYSVGSTRSERKRRRK